MDKKELFASLEAQHRLPNGLLNSVMMQESRGNANALSPKGASGYFQFMPATAKQYGVNPNDLQSSATGAARMYADLLKQNNGDLNKALAGYNWGQGNVTRKGLDKAPKETRDYIVKVKQSMGGYGSMGGGGEMESELKDLSEWELVKPAQPEAKDLSEWELVKPANNTKPKDIGITAKDVKQVAGDLIAGGVRGAGSIGSTLIALDEISPIGMIRSTIQGREINPLNRDAERRAGMDGGLAQLGANPNSGTFKVGKFAGEVAGTAGTGNALALGAKGAPLFANALKSGGLSLGGSTGSAIVDNLLRVGGGAISGGAAAGLADPRSAKTGAIFGASIPAAGQGVKAIGSGLAHAIGGIGTHTGGESIKQAARAGFEGGDRMKSFWNNMHGNVPMTDVLDDVNANLQKMGVAKNAQYRSGMLDISKDRAILDFSNIDDAIDKSIKSTMFKGKVTSPSEHDVLVKVKGIVDDWKLNNPSEYHTPEGMDALKRQVGDVLEGIPFENSNARRVVGSVYSSIKNDISRQAPTYSKVMKDYGEASEHIKEIKSALLGSRKASADTSMRKLQSIMRNNANTNYGNRLNMANIMADEGGKDILPALAGQALNSWTPRGLGGAVAGATGVGGYVNPSILAALIPQSPRLMGYGALGTGLLSQGVYNTAKQAIPTVGGLSSLLYQYNNQE